MSFLNSTHNTTPIVKKLGPPITKSQVLALLHDHDKMIRLNTQVTAHKRQPDSVSTSFFKDEAAELKPRANGPPIPVYSITDSMSDGEEAEAKGGSWMKKLAPEAITYDSSMQDVDDGLVSITHASGGVHSTTRWSVKDEDGGLTLEEVGKVTANRLVMGIVKSTLQGSHGKMVDAFVARLEKNVSEGNGTV